MSQGAEIKQPDTRARAGRVTPREAAAKALYEHWCKDDFANEHIDWGLLPGKQPWLERADVALKAAIKIAAPEIADTVIAEIRNFAATQHG